jgi:hypothetical protein
MMNEEMYIKSRMGQENPFRVPDGYFDSFAAEMMKKLPELPEQSEQPKTGLLVRLRPWMYAAACMVVAIFTATLYFVNDTPSQEVPAAVAATSDTYVEDVADYMMADNLDIYACLASEY